MFNYEELTQEQKYMLSDTHEFLDCADMFIEEATDRGYDCGEAIELFKGFCALRCHRIHLWYDEEQALINSL